MACTSPDGIFKEEVHFAHRNAVSIQLLAGLRVACQQDSLRHCDSGGLYESREVSSGEPGDSLLKAFTSQGRGKKATQAATCAFQ